MTYTKAGPFVNGGAPYLTAGFFNGLESGIAGLTPSGGDDTAAIQAALTAAAGGGTAHLGTGTFNISAALTLPSTASLILDPGTVVKATATIAGAMLTCGDGTNTWTRQTLRGGLFDCNGNASNAVTIRNALASSVLDVNWINPTLHGLIVGVPADTSTSHEVTVSRCKGDRTIGGLPPAGSYGVWMQNGFDCVIEDTVIVGAQRSFRNDANGNTFSSCHGYGLGGGSAQYPVAVFSENGSDNEYRSCYADTPLTYGFEITSNAYRTRILGGIVYLNSDSPDNVVIGIHTALANPNGLSVLGVEFYGQGASNRLAKDYDGTVPAPGLTYAGILSGSGNHVTTSVLTGHGNLPSVTASGATGAGTSPPAPTLAAGSTDRRGTVSFGTGTGAAAGQVVWVTFNETYGSTPTILVTPRNFATAALGVWPQTVGPSSFSVSTTSSPASSQSGTTYQFDYVVIQ